MKSILLGLIVFGFFVQQAPGDTQKHDFKGAATAEVYKKASGDDLWIYRFDPEGHDTQKDRRPAVVFFFGGGWNGGSVTQFEQHSKYLASRGIVAFVADYRVKSRQKTGPDACVADGKSAVRWIRTNAERLGIDPTRIAAGGGSAGGHVAATTGICDGLDDAAEENSNVSSKSNALLLFNPVYDNGPKGYGHSRVKDRYKEISPFHNIRKGIPPAIVFLGTKDKLIPVSTAEEFKKRMEDVGSESQLFLYDDQPHGFFNFAKSDGKYYRETVIAMDRFLVKQGFLTGNHTITAGDGK